MTVYEHLLNLGIDNPLLLCLIIAMLIVGASFKFSKP